MPGFGTTQDNPFTSTRVLYTNQAKKSIGNVTTATSIVPATFSGPGLLLPANFWTVGKSIRITIYGVYSAAATTASATATIKVGTATPATITVAALANAVTNFFWGGEVILTCLSTGSSGTVLCSGELNFRTGAVGQAYGDLGNGGTPVTVDTTIANQLDLLGSFGSAVTGQDITTGGLTVEAYN